MRFPALVPRSPPLGSPPSLIRRLSIWTEFFGLDWARAEATLERGQGQARQHQQSDIG